MQVWWSKLRRLFTRGDLDRDLRAELDAHVQMEVEASLDRGMGPNEALDTARRHFGNRTIIEESSREAWMFIWFETILQDLRYALRTLRRSSAFAVTAVSVIALGIGASATVFTVVNAVLLRPLPYPHQERLVVLWGDLRKRDVTDFPFAPGDFHDLRENGTAFEQLAAVVSGRVSVSGDDGEPEQIRSATVTPNFLALLGARIVLGRDFRDADGIPRPEPAAAPLESARDNQAPLPVSAILSHGFWHRRYGGDPRVIGRVIDVGGNRAEVVGVVAPGFELLFPTGSGVDPMPDIYVAARVNYESGARMNVSLRVLGRLRDGATIEQAGIQLDQIAADLRQRFPIKAAAGYYIRAEPMHEDLVADVRPTLASLMGAVVFVLLIACANVANLFLVRVSARTTEFAVRAALGGSRSRLVRQMLVESLVLAGGGTILGLALTAISVRALLVLGPETLPRIGTLDIDARVLLFSVTAAVMTAVVFGAVPAMRASRPRLMALLRAGGRLSTLSGGRVLRDAVVTAEVAFSFVLLIGGGLMIRSFAELHKAYPGYEPEGVLTFAVDHIRARQPEERAAFARELRRRLLALPGVQSVTAAQSVPLDGRGGNVRWGTEAAAADPSRFQQASANTVLPGYFQTLRTGLREGRAFADDDNSSSSRQIVIDRVLAAKAFPNASAVGKRLLVRSRREQAEWLEVIGVVDHQRIDSPAMDGREAVFFVDGFTDHGAASRWLVRVTGDPAGLAPQVRAVIKEMDPLIVLADVEPMRTLVDRVAAPTRFALILIGTFAVVAVVLAAIGLYGVLATTVRQRTSEIGVRLAFGATRGSIAALVLRQGLRVSVAGVALGCLGALPLTPFMASMLIGVTPTDLLTFASIAVGCLAVSAVASYLPARRAARVDPAGTLRE